MCVTCVTGAMRMASTHTDQYERSMGSQGFKVSSGGNGDSDQTVRMRRLI